MAINYECEIEEKLWNGLKKKFSIDSDSELYAYLLLRTALIYGNKNQLAELMLSELFIKENTYKEIPIYLFSYSENSLGNIIDDLAFQYSDKMELLSLIQSEAKKEWIKFYQDHFSPFYRLYFELNILNKLFHVELNEVEDIEGFIQLEHRINKELECKRYLDSAKLKYTEKDLEDFLYKNLDVIEPGMKLIQRQFELPEGRIDILAKDKDDVPVIIELKIAKDKTLVWQCMYYQDEIEKHFKCKPRMITIAPSYPSHILKQLQKFDNVEMYTVATYWSSNQFEFVINKYNQQIQLVQDL